MGERQPSAKRQRLNEYLIEKVERSNQNRLILFIDEAQKLHEPHYRWLIDIHNELDSHNIVLIVLLVGQEELGHQLTAFQAADKTQIVGRFMVQRFTFRGMRSAKDLEICLGNYDRGSEYPPGSKCSFTRYYFPEAFDSGFRLASYAEILWQAFREVREAEHLPITTEIPMQYFCRTVEYVLARFGTLESLTRDLSLNQWKQAIKQSGYTDAEKYVVESRNMIK